MPDIADIKRTTPGQSKIYSRWVNMRQRCNNPNNPSYIHYGARGIKVCNKWDNSFESFFYWAIENGYDDSLQIDRINNNKGYSPENCRFVSHTQNIRNRTITKLSQNLVDEIRDRYRPRCRINGAAAMSREFGLHKDTVEKIIKRKLWI
jgi:hypothetical protein